MMNQTTTDHLPRPLWALMLIGLTGCNSDINAYCAEAMGCVNGNDEDETACQASVRHEREQADIYSCKDDYNTYLDCLIDKSGCETSEDDADTWTDEGKCSDKWGDYAQCLDDNSKVINIDA